MSFTQYHKVVGTLARALNAVGKKTNLSELQRADIIKKALKAARAVAFNDLISQLEQQSEELDRGIEETLKQRREDLLRAARDENVPHKRFTDFDRVSVFKITYKGRKVRLHIGSELLRILEEVDGRKLFEAIQKEASKLESEPFSREEYFEALKIAFSIARSKGQQKDGAVAVKTLYPYVVLARHTQIKQFLNSPGLKRFQEYSTAQFVYDLARFGRKGWSFGNEVISTQTPNMATISAGKTMTLPILDSVEGSSKPFATLMIKKKEN